MNANATIRYVVSALLLFSLTSIANVVAAATIHIQFTGLDITYNGSILTTVSNPDPLDSVTLKVDANLAGPVLVAPTDNISAALSLAVTNIPAVGGIGITTAAPGSFDLELLTGGLNLSLTQATVQYVQTGFIDFIFSGAFASIDSQDLPYGLVIGEPVTLSFSAQVDSGSVTSSGDYLTGFTASGTGEVQGAVVPVPAAVWLFGSGLLGLVGMTRRKKAA